MAKESGALSKAMPMLATFVELVCIMSPLVLTQSSLLPKPFSTRPTLIWFLGLITPYLLSCQVGGLLVPGQLPGLPETLLALMVS